MKSDSKRFVESLIGKNGAEKVAKVVVFRFFCEHFQCKDHPNEKNMSNKKDEEKQPFQPPTSQWLFTPLKINMEYNHGGLEDHFPF